MVASTMIIATPTLGIARPSQSAFDDAAMC
jgi:hypothetical protein